MESIKSQIIQLLSEYNIEASDHTIDLMEQHASKARLTPDQLERSMGIINAKTLNEDSNVISPSILSAWKERIDSMMCDSQIKSNEESKVIKGKLLEEVWRALPYYTPSDRHYVKYNEEIPRRFGKDNVFDSWELKIPSILKLDTYKYLFQTHSKKLKFRKQLKQEIAERIQRDFKLDKLPGFDVDPEKQIICGEIGNDAEENIGPNSIILINRDIDESEREYIPISIDESIKDFSFFEGEIQCALQRYATNSDNYLNSKRLRK